ncbi:MAG: hypothetical protein Q7U73_04280 [Rubrivivax sp.]|nr:hypothetical protein [Rubrivivax sp.]
MSITLAVDFGSTCTKVVAIDCAGETLVGVAPSPLAAGPAALEAASARGGARRGTVLRRADAGADADLVHPLDLPRIDPLTAKGHP